MVRIPPILFSSLFCLKFSLHKMACMAESKRPFIKMKRPTKSTYAFLEKC